jgi:hypothetical protein
MASDRAGIPCGLPPFGGNLAAGGISFGKKVGDMRFLGLEDGRLNRFASLRD